MSELPQGWGSPTLSEIADINPRCPRDVDDEMPVSFIPMPAVSENSPDLNLSIERKLRAVRKGFTHFADGDVLFAKITPCMENGKGAVAKCLTNGLGFGTTELHVLRPALGIDPYYVYHFLHQDSFRKAAERSFTGSAGQARVPVVFMRESEIPLAPVAEQRRIVAKLDALLARVDACRQRLDKIPKLLARFRQSVLAAACTGQLTQNWRAMKESTPPGDIYVPPEDAPFEVPDGWRWERNRTLTLPKQGAICAGPFGTIFKAKDFREAGVPIIFLRHVASGKYLTSKPGFMDSAKWEELFRPYSVYGGELLVTKLGDPPGTCAIYPRGIGPAMVTPDVIKMEVNEELANPKYLMSFFNSVVSRNIMFGLAFGVTRLRVDLPMFKNLWVPVPPIAEQEEIVRRLDQLFAFADRLEARVQAARRRVDALTQSILAKAFRGELVPTEAELAEAEARTFESAGQLLNRIRTERETTIVTTSRNAPSRKHKRRQ